MTIKQPHQFTNTELSKLWRTQEIETLPSIIRKSEIFVLFRIDLKKSEGDELVKQLKRTMIRAVSLKDDRSKAHERYNVWISTQKGES
jgi:hypothetical protein